MNELPQGTVTFLFTDIEGSTALLKRLGHRYHEVLDAHARILREAAASHRGREVDNQGDSFFFAFARANAALGAAVVAQRALAAHEWPDGADVRVRMGLHTGEPSVGGERYVGLGVHRAARIGAAGHGGQVLLSNPTRELVEEEMDDVVVRDVGLYKLKDIDRPEHLFQLDIGGLPTDFPPLKAEKVESDRRFSRRPVVIGALAGVIAAAVAIPVFALGGGNGTVGPSSDRAESNTLAVIAPGSKGVIADPGVGQTPTAVAFGEGGYWVANTNANGGTVSRIDPKTNTVSDTITNVGNGPSGIAIGKGFVWVTNSLDGTVAKIDPATNTVVQMITVGNGPVGIVYAAGAVWVANTSDDTITRIDASNGRAGKPLPIAATELAFGDKTLWATQQNAGQVVRIDPNSGQLAQAPIRVGNGPTGVAFGAGAAWVANSLDGTVSRIDPATNSITATVATGDTPVAVTVDVSGDVWVANEYGGTLRRIDPATNQPASAIELGNQPQGVTAAGENVLVTVAARPGAAHRGGTLRLLSNGFLDSIDTAVAYSPTSWPLLRLTNDGLVAFDHASGVAGDQPVPDLAVSLPAPTDGGRTYTFRLRPNVRYSDGTVVRPSDVRASLERYFRNGSLPVAFYDGIVGAEACSKSRCDLSRGILTDDRTGTVTFHLTAADPEFLYKLAVPSASVLPAGTAARLRASHPLPATGAYMVSEYRPAHSLTLVRNPYFREWSRAAQPDGYPDQIELTLNGKETTDSLIRKVTAGEADLVSGITNAPPSPAQLQATTSEFASQVHANPFPEMSGLFLNTRVSPFDNLDVRKALNYAVDRSAAVEAAGGLVLAAPTCQVLPPGLPGYGPYCPYTAGHRISGHWIAPDLSRARRLVAHSGTFGMKVTVWVDNFSVSTGPFVAKLLRSLGYRPAIKTLQNGKGFIYFPVVGNSSRKAQIGLWNWVADYPAASDFFLQLLTCDSFKPNSANNSNWPEFCDPAVDRLVKHALALEVSNPQAAAGLWQRVDRAVADQAPVVPLVNGKAVDVVSKRVGNYQYSGNGFGVLIDELWVK